MMVRRMRRIRPSVRRSAAARAAADARPRAAEGSKTQAPSSPASAPAAWAWPRLPVLEQRHLDLIGLALVAAGIFFAGLIYLDWDGGAGGSWAVDGLRDADRRRALRRAGGAGRGRRDPRPAADAARRAAVPGRRPVPVRRAGARARGRHARPRTGWQRGALGRRVGAAARRRLRRGLVLGRLDACSAPSARTSWRCSCSWPRAAADRRVDRGRREGDHDVGVVDDARHARARCSGGARPRSCAALERGSRGSRGRLRARAVLVR